jgi:NTP pyrophosphatase (non-canonical NTP hydrolase)
MNLQKFSIENLRRCIAPNGFNHNINGWSSSDWMTAVVGEVGEAANVIKKLNRVRDGIPGNKETPEELKAMLADEIADAAIYLDLLASSLGLDLSEIILSKFDRTSKKIGYIDNGL